MCLFTQMLMSVQLAQMTVQQMQHVWTLKAVTCVHVILAMLEMERDAMVIGTNHSFWWRLETAFILLSAITIDIDECTSNTSTCSEDATCTNTDGSYTCTCNVGLNGDGVTCSGMCVLHENRGNY